MNNLVSTPVILRDNGGLSVWAYVCDHPRTKAAYAPFKRRIERVVNIAYERVSLSHLNFA